MIIGGTVWNIFAIIDIVHNVVDVRIQLVSRLELLDQTSEAA